MKRPNIENFKLEAGATVHDCTVASNKYSDAQDKYINYLEAKFNNVGLADVSLSLPTPESWQMYTKAHELDEKEFEQWLFDFGK